MKTKVCTKCLLDLDSSSFYKDKSKKDGLSSSCKECHRSYHASPESRQKKRDYQKTNKYRQYLKKYRQTNKRQIAKREREYYQKEEVKARRRNYYNTPEQKQKKKNAHQRKLQDVQYKLNCAMSKAISKYLSKHSMRKTLSWIKYVDYTLLELKTHIESLFVDGMSWDNYGMWHLDHIVPKHMFEIKYAGCPEFVKCWSLSNLRPLWAVDNLTRPKDGSDINVLVQ